MPNAQINEPLSGPRVATLAYDGLCTFEFGVAYEVFGLPRPEMGAGWYQYQTIAVEDGPLRAAGGLTITAGARIDALNAANLIIIPGWRGVDEPVPEQLIAALRAARQRGSRLATLCSGVFVLAAAGLLDGCRATTHWRYAAALAERFPLIDVNPDVLYVDNGGVLTAAGSAAGIDLCLHIVRQDFGTEAANTVARRLVVPPHRDGGQAQFIRHPVPRPRESGRLGKVLHLIEASPVSDLSIAALARTAGMSIRTFQRRFENITGMSVGAYVVRSRIRYAQMLLETQQRISMDEVATASGFSSVELLRHHFRKELKTTPRAWRDRFGEPVRATRPLA
jgi:AraC family transcriptional regulator, transcriptional activator FtrA